MKRLATVAISASLAAASICSAQNNTLPVITPDGKYLYAHRDTCDLFMDVYEPNSRSDTYFESHTKPTVIYIFGGGFKSGNRSEEWTLPYFKSLTDNGYRVISIDYRLGLKDATSVGITHTAELDKAIHLAVEDLFSATSFIIDNADEMGISPDSLVLCGSSAGAITALQADYEKSRSTICASSLPKGFRYAGIMAFSGGIFTRDWGLKYIDAPAPALLFHGTDDKLVNYKRIKFFNLGFYGTDHIAKQYKRMGVSYNVYRYQGYGHEISSIMERTLEEQFRFLENNVILGNPVCSDTLVTECEIPKWEIPNSRKELYNKK
ncbi:MAG: alpha/beta hydrolase [Candidatus Cryptobacteroides sp.]